MNSGTKSVGLHNGDTGSTSAGKEQITAPSQDRMIGGFEVLAALYALDDLHGPGPHPLRDVVDLVDLPKTSVCRLLRIAELRYGLVTRPGLGLYELVRPSAPGERSETSDSRNLWDHPASACLDSLSARTGVPVLSYTAHRTDQGTTERHLTAHALGAARPRILRAGLHHQNALLSAPATSDAAGIALLGHSRFAAQTVAATWASNGTVGTRSPLPDHDMIAATVWQQRRILGSLALLVPHAMGNGHREFVAGHLAAEAARLSHSATRDHARGGLLAG